MMPYPIVAARPDPWPEPRRFPLFCAAMLVWGAIVGAGTALGGGLAGQPPAAVFGWLALVAVLAAATVLLARFLCRGRAPAGSPQDELSDPNDRAILARAREEATVVRRVWRHLGPLADSPDPATVLDETLDQLHRALLERQTLRRAFRRTQDAAVPVPAAATGAWRDRRQLVFDRIRERDLRIDAGLRDLLDLGDACAACLDQQVAWERTRRLVSELDEVLVETGTAVTRMEPLRAFVERTTSVVHAYRELTS